MSDFNRTNPSVLGFRLERSWDRSICDVCGSIGWEGHVFFVCGPWHACTEECAAELGHAPHADPPPMRDGAAALRSRQCDVVTAFRATGMV